MAAQSPHKGLGYSSSLYASTLKHKNRAILQTKCCIEMEASMIRYKSHSAMKSDRNILIHALKNEKPLVPGKKMAKWLSVEFMQQRSDVMLLEEYQTGDGDLDNTWYVAYNSPIGICLFELTESLLEKSNYGIES